MLKQVLHEIETAAGPVHVGELSQRLGIERSALEGMIAYWVHKGRLVDDETAAASTSDTCHCGPSCSDTDSCAFVAKMPKSYTIHR